MMVGVLLWHRGARQRHFEGTRTVVDGRVHALGVIGHDRRNIWDNLLSSLLRPPTVNMWMRTGILPASDEEQ